MEAAARSEVLVGGVHKTNIYRIEYLWPGLGGYQDQRLLSSVAAWLSKNVRSINKKDPDMAAKELASEFPQLAAVTVYDQGGRMAQWRRL